MRVVVAPDKFKGSLTALEAAAAISRGLRGVPGCALDIACVPMADGGEGTVDAFVQQGATRHTVAVRGPLGAPVDAAFALTPQRVAVVEMATASGLLLVDEGTRDVMRASSYGTGEVLRAVLDLAPERIVLGIGGSATNDGGTGLLSALGARFLDRDGEQLAPGGGALAELASIDVSRLDPRIVATTLDVACDVDNPLLGPVGSSQAYGPQKGASSAEVERLEAGLRRFADLTAALGGGDVREQAGAGAAGGIGFALLAYLRAALRPGLDVVADACGLDDALRGARWCCTGEGRIDAQTLRGKTVAGVARRAAVCGVSVVAFAGSVDASIEAALYREHGVTAFPIVAKPMSLDEALAQAPQLLEAAAARVGRLLLCSGD